MKSGSKRLTSIDFSIDTVITCWPNRKIQKVSQDDTSDVEKDHEAELRNMIYRSFKEQCTDLTKKGPPTSVTNMVSKIILHTITELIDNCDEKQPPVLAAFESHISDLVMLLHSDCTTTNFNTLTENKPRQFDTGFDQRYFSRRLKRWTRSGIDARDS
jgi:hypothetical protein